MWNHYSFFTDLGVSEYDYDGVIISDMEELPRLDLPLDHEILESIDTSVEYVGKVAFMNVTFRHGSSRAITFPVIYALCENEAFCSKVLLENKAELSHIVHVRYGGGCGGGYASGAWLLVVLENVFIKYAYTKKSSKIQLLINSA